MRYLVLFAMALATVPALADDDEEKPVYETMRFIERGDALTVTTTITKLFDLQQYNKLDTGFTSTVVIRIWVYPIGSTDPVGFVLLQRAVLYDVWDEEYQIKIDGPGPAYILKEKRKAEALRRLTTLEDVPIARLSNLAFGSPNDHLYMVAMQVELNPVSKETLAEVRRWLSQGTGGGLDRGGAFFGSFASVFINPKIPEADRVLRIRSQPFFRDRSSQ
jgi:hypothetical protein